MFFPELQRRYTWRKKPRGTPSPGIPAHRDRSHLDSWPPTITLDLEVRTWIEGSRRLVGPPGTPIDHELVEDLALTPGPEPGGPFPQIEESMDLLTGSLNRGPIE